MLTLTSASAASIACLAGLISFAQSSPLPVVPRHCGGSVRHVHIAVGRDPSTEMIVSFASILSIYSAPIGGVLVGESPTSMDMAFVESDTASAYNLTVHDNRGNYGDNLQLYFSPYYHHVTISGLKPGTTYFYKPEVHSKLRGFAKYDVRNAEHIGSKEHEMVEKERQSYRDDGEDVPNDAATRHRYLQSLPAYDGSQVDCPSPHKIRTFTTGPAPATPGDDSTLAPIAIAVVGDLGQFQHSEQTLSSLMRWRHELDAIILAGDIAYSRLVSCVLKYWCPVHILATYLTRAHGHTGP